MGCTTTADIDSHIVSLEQSGIKSPASFFILKGNENDYINNIDFNKYSSYLGETLEKKGWEPVSYGEAKIYLFFEYGIDAFYQSKRRIKPKYDEESGVTSWVHKDSQIERMVYLRITAADGDDYRLRKKRSVRWDLLVRNPEKAQLSDRILIEMINAGSSFLD